MAQPKPDFDDFAAYLIDGYPQYSLTAKGAVWFTDLLTDPKWLKLAHDICEQHGIDFEPVLDRAEALREQRAACDAQVAIFAANMASLQT